MSLISLFSWQNTDRKTRNSRNRRPQPRRARLGGSFLARLELLEDRALLSTVTVENLADHGAGSLRAALASGATTIDFAPGLHGAIQLTSGELSVTGSVNIDGPGANKLAVSGNDTSRVFDISGSANVSISGLTITDGQATAGGGILLDDSASLSLNKLTLSGNEALGSLAGSETVPDGDGGGIEDNSSGSLTVTNSTFDANHVSARGPNAPLNPGYIIALGGAIDVSAFSTGTATISDSTFTRNEALGGVAGASAGGGALSDSSTSFGATANMIVSGCTLRQNEAMGAAGGGLNNSINFGSGQGGAINNFANLTVDNSTVSDNLAEGTPLAPVLRQRRVLAGSAVGGGGIFEVSNFPNGNPMPAVMTVVDSTITGNQAVGGAGSPGDVSNPASAGSVADGGGIAAVVFSVAQVVGCTLSDNVAQGGAGGGSGAVGAPGVSGGIDIGVFSSVIVSDTTLIHNHALGGAGGAGATGGDGVGGGIDVGTGFLLGVPSDTSSLNLTDSSLVGNQAVGGAGGPGGNGGDGQGGGVSVLTGASANIVASSIVANQAQGGVGGTGGNGGNGFGGGLYNDAGATLTLTASTVTGNRADGGEEGHGGADGQGVGGGVYNAGTFTRVSNTIKGNHASTSNGDIYP